MRSESASSSPKFLNSTSKTNSSNKRRSYDSSNLKDFPNPKFLIQYNELSFNNNPITSLKNLPTIHDLFILSLDNTKIESFEGAKVQPQLLSVSMRSSPISLKPHFIEMCLIAFGNQLIKVNGATPTKKQHMFVHSHGSVLYKFITSGWIFTSLDNPVKLLNVKTRKRKQIHLNEVDDDSTFNLESYDDQELEESSFMINEKGSCTQQKLNYSGMSTYSFLNDFVDHTRSQEDEEKLDKLLDQLTSLSRKWNFIPPHKNKPSNNEDDKFFKDANIFSQIPISVVRNRRLNRTKGGPLDEIKHVISVHTVTPYAEDRKPYLLKKLESIHKAVEYEQSKPQHLASRLENREEEEEIPEPPLQSKPLSPSFAQQAKQDEEEEEADHHDDPYKTRRMATLTKFIMNVKKSKSIDDDHDENMTSKSRRRKTVTDYDFMKRQSGSDDYLQESGTVLRAQSSTNQILQDKMPIIQPSFLEEPKDDNQDDNANPNSLESFRQEMQKKKELQIKRRFSQLHRENSKQVYFDDQMQPEPQNTNNSKMTRRKSSGSLYEKTEPSQSNPSENILDKFKQEQEKRRLEEEKKRQQEEEEKRRREEQERKQREDLERRRKEEEEKEKERLRKEEELRIEREAELKKQQDAFLARIDTPSDEDDDGDLEELTKTYEDIELDDDHEEDAETALRLKAYEEFLNKYPDKIDNTEEFEAFAEEYIKTHNS